ncbi:MAG TPA: gliding motility-associated C-terminal domain-containing protein, partial [Bacteroidia bacterium]|nr:gliding motility-associated C-terminal domain-containing protein [Bacteroidia bacterium]
INASPTVSVLSTGIASEICPGDTMGLLAGGASTYTWSPSTGLNVTTGSHVIASPGTTQTYTVTGYNGSLCSDTASIVVLVYPHSTVTISPVSPNICSGDSVTLNASGATNYSWSPGSGLSCILCSNPNASPSSTITYTVTGKGTGGCASKDSVVLAVTPTPTLLITPSKPAICKGISVPLVVSGASSYTWSPPGGLSCTSCDSTTANPGSTSIYTVTGTSSGCSSKDSVTVTIDIPVVTPSASSPTICSGSSSVLSATGATNYTWSPPGGLSCTSCDSTTANPGSSTTYTLIGIDTAGCSDTTSIILTVTPTPTISVSATASSICQGNKTQLIASGASNYMWSPPGGLSCTSCDSTTANPGSTTTFTVVGTNGSSCKDTTTFVLTVNPTPTVTISAAGGDTICQGQSTILTANGSATNYIWSNGSVTSTINVSPTTPTTYTVYASNGTCSDSAITTVNVYPKFNIVMPQDSICAGAQAIVSVNASGGKPSYTYAWNNGLGSGAGPYTVSPATLTYYVCTVTDGCGDTIKDSSKVFISVTPHVTFTGTPDTVPGGQYVSFTNTSTNATSYYWNFGDGNTSTDSSVYEQYNEQGIYIVTLVGSNSIGCSDTAWDTIHVTQGIYIPNVFTPNGDGQNDVFHVTAGGIQFYNIEIFDRWGQKVFIADSPNIDWTGRSDSGVEDSDGTYYYIIKATAFDKTSYNFHGYIELIR